MYIYCKSEIFTFSHPASQFGDPILNNFVLWHTKTVSVYAHNSHNLNIDSMWKLENWKIGKCEIGKCENVEMWKCGNVEMWKCENVEM